MFEEHEESPAERPRDPADQAKEKAEEFRIHAELAAVFEGVRKFDAALRPGLDPDLAREVQRTIGRLEKSKKPDSPVLPEESAPAAAELLNYPEDRELAPNDYHIYRRPGEVMVVRWLDGDLVEAFYERLQAHFDAAMAGHKEDEQQASSWKQDAKAAAYVAALELVQVDMAERYLREPIRKLNLFVLSTLATDEINIKYLCDYVMGVAPEELVGEKSAPPADPTDQDLAWFFKLFSLRGMRDGVERMCFFAYLQKADEGW